MNKKKYNEVCWLAAHNAFSSLKHGWLYHQQTLSLSEQFRYGVRCFLIDVHWMPAGCQKSRRLALMHGESIHLNHLQRPAPPKSVKWFLRKLRSWFDEDEKAIITLIIEDYVGDEGYYELKQQLREYDLLKMCWVGSNDFPTLKEMRDNNHRLVIITSHNSLLVKNSKWIMPEADILSSNHWDATAYPRGDQVLRMGKPLAIFNHFKPVSLGGVCVYNKFNSRERINQRLTQYKEKFRQSPNFVALDFIQWGKGKEIVEKINNLGT